MIFKNSHKLAENVNKIVNKLEKIDNRNVNKLVENEFYK